MNDIEPRVLFGIGEKKSNNNTQWYLQDRVYDSNVAVTIATVCNPYYEVSWGGNLMEENKKLTIRKLTPRECGRLMGIKDEDIDLILEVLNDRQAYSVFGDSIVTTCIMNIMSSFYDIDYKEKVNPKEWWNNDI